MSENNQSNFLIKIDTIRKNTYGAKNFLKSGDIIVALNNQLYIFGEKQFTDELRELKKSQSKALLTILREDTFFDLVVENSLGCKFLTITPEETKKTPYYIKKMRLRKFKSASLSNTSDFDEESLKKASYPCDLASMAVSKSLTNVPKSHLGCTKA